MSISTAQIRGARGLLNWSQGELAERTGLSLTSISQIEAGSTVPRKKNLDIIRGAFENSGIEFIPNHGVRLSSGDVRILSGRNGYLEFFTDVYNTLDKTGRREVLVSNVDERHFVKWHGEAGGDHLDRMRGLSGLRYRILIQEGDDFFPAQDYAEYRWLAKEHFSSVPFYVYGEKLGILLFADEPKIILLDFPAITQAYRHQFDGLWQSALRPARIEGTR
jgi:transcriptional regulator with XRE-family HTH domain